MKIIAERYEIQKLIGQGGMADVYLAKDTILNRIIAIKILRTGLAKDPVYVTRFQREASAAASLSHKNIVEIYDVGEDANQYYIVMEYVPGTTLKELINRRGALHVVEAIDIMKQVVEGTVKAHQLGIIHRDLKPQNILVTDSGIAKIADFGIASMQSLAQVTQTDVIMGSLHYLAPELARGEKATNQSDIYALGIVLYELLRGEVPFNGESPVNIALEHMQKDLPSICDFNPSIPQSVENIIIKATAKNRKDRYQNSSEMLDDITMCLERDEEKLVFKYDASDADPTIVLGSKGPYSEGSTSEIPPIQQTDEPKRRKKISKKTKIMAAAISALAIIAVLFSIFLFGQGHKDAIMMPNVLGKTKEKAISILEKEYGLQVRVAQKEIASDEYEEGLVAKTDPAANSSIKAKGIVTLTISKGKYVVIKDYVGKSIDDAKDELQELGFEVTVRYQTDSADIGTVLEQSIKSDTKLEPDRKKEITLTVSKGNAIVIDNYIDMQYEQARQELTALGCKVRKNEIESEKAVGIVIAQSKEAGTRIEPGSNATITLTVSKGKTYDVPDVHGLSYSNAEAKLKEAGFQVISREGAKAATKKDALKVYEQSVPPGKTNAKPGTIYLTYYGDYEDTKPTGSEVNT